MLFSLAASTLALSTALTIVTGAPLSPSTSGLIVSPASGTVIAPGSAFDFLYTTRADYGISSYNFTVMLLTTLPTSFATSDAFGTGYYFGRFAEPNYPGNPSPKNLPPAQLIMPDFAKNPGGFGAGATANNDPVYLAVLEEYATGSGSVGLRLGLTVNQLVYNGTSQN